MEYSLDAIIFLGEGMGKYPGKLLSDNIFDHYFDITFEDEFISTDELSKIVGKGRSALLGDVQENRLDAWVKVPDDVRVVGFPMSSLMMSGLKEEVDYIPESLVGVAPRMKVVLSARYHSLRARAISASYLWVPYQKLRWCPSGQFCSFLGAISISGGDRGKYFSDMEHGLSVGEDELPEVFITFTYDPDRECRCKSECIGEYELYSFSRDSIRWFPMDSVPFVTSRESAKSYLIREKEKFYDYRELLLELIDLKDMDFLKFPEDLFKVFVVACRAIEGVSEQGEIEKSCVTEGLTSFGVSQSLTEYVRPLIAWDKKSCSEAEGGRHKQGEVPKVDSGKEFISQLECLRVARLFKVFKEFYEDGGRMSAEVVIGRLIKHGLGERAAKECAPIVRDSQRRKVSWGAVKALLKLST